MSAYASSTDLYALGIKADALASVSSTIIDAELEAQARVIDSYIGTLGPLPLLGWGGDIRRANAVLAVPGLLLGIRGADPGNPGNAFWERRAMETTLWLRDVSAGKCVPVGLVFSSATPVAEPSPAVFTTQRRGW